jgi:hypothetical protein
MNEANPNSDECTLDPPGSIAVIGAGPIGIEAALYGRYLGYEVTLFEAVAIGSSMLDHQPLPLPMLPDRCLSRLASAALAAQRGQICPPSEPLNTPDRSSSAGLPMTIGQWIHEALIPLTETDLLRDRVRCPAPVSKISTIPVELDAADEESEDVPADFCLHIAEPSTVGEIRHRTEAVIVATGGATGGATDIELEFALPADYFFVIEAGQHDDPELEHRARLKQIVTIYARLVGRPDLDLYRPPRG